MKLKVQDPIPDSKIFHLINGEPKEQNISQIKVFTKLIGAEVDRNSKGMGIRSSRYSIIIEKLRVLDIYEEEETKNCRISSADHIYDLI